MKRLIKYWNTYNDNYFSNTSTEYEILDLVSDDFGNKELRELAKLNGLETIGNCFTPQRGKVSTAIKLNETKQKITNHFRNETKEVQIYLGFYDLPNYQDVPPLETTDNKVTTEMLRHIIDSQVCGIDDLAEINGELTLILGSWDFYHELPLLGYSHESLKEVAGTDETCFYDSVFRCGECGEYDWNDSGYTYNYRIIDCEILGLNCGCYDDFCQSEGAIDFYADNPDNAMEASAVEKHVENNKLTFLQRFVGGMTDSWRSHHYDGESVEISTPEEALSKFQSQYPGASFVFCHDESGQFQTYFSIYKVEQ